MSKKYLCIFDLDGTLYPKETRITHEIRKRIIQQIASKNILTLDTAKALYNGLPQKYPNPYDGLQSLNISGYEYQEVFNSIDIENCIQPDKKLINLFQQLSKNADIYIVSFAPEEYVNRVLNALGIYSFIKCVISVSHDTSYSKTAIFNTLSDNHLYEAMFAVGDDEINDLIPAEKAGFMSYLVNFDKKGADVYSKINQIDDFIKKKRIPRIMRIENTSICNESCIICPYEKMKRHKGMMSDTLFKKLIIEHSSSVNNPKLIFPASIGEPFVDRHFLDKVSFASNYYSDIATFTNGSLLSKEVFLKYVQLGGSELVFTLHGFTKNMHSYITKTHFYNAVRSNIEMIAAINNRLDNPITLFLDIYADYSDECMCYIKNMTNLGVIANRFDLEELHNWGGKINIYSKKKTHDHCHRIYDQFGVQYNGIVVPCCVDIEGDYILGNATNHSLKQIFSSIKYNKLVNMEEQGSIKKNPLCFYCNSNI